MKRLQKMYIFTHLVGLYTQSLFGIWKKKTKTPRRVYSVNYDRILFTYSLYSAANNQMGIENCENSIFICVWPDSVVTFCNRQQYKPYNTEYS